MNGSCICFRDLNGFMANHIHIRSTSHVHVSSCILISFLHQGKWIGQIDVMSFCLPGLYSWEKAGYLGTYAMAAVLNGTHISQPLTKRRELIHRIFHRYYNLSTFFYSVFVSSFNRIITLFTYTHTSPSLLCLLKRRRHKVWL